MEVMRENSFMGQRSQLSSLSLTMNRHCCRRLSCQLPLWKCQMVYHRRNHFQRVTSKTSPVIKMIAVGWCDFMRRFEKYGKTGHERYHVFIFYYVPLLMPYFVNMKVELYGLFQQNAKWWAHRFLLESFHQGMNRWDFVQNDSYLTISFLFKCHEMQLDWTP